MSLFNDIDSITNQQTQIDLYVAAVQWLQRHCGSEIIYKDGGTDIFRSPFVSEESKWTCHHGISSKVILKWDDSNKKFIILAKNPGYFVYTINDKEPDFLDFSQCNVVFIGCNGEFIKKDAQTREIILKTTAVKAR